MLHLKTLMVMFVVVTLTLLEKLRKEANNLRKETDRLTHVNIYMIYEELYNPDLLFLQTFSNKKEVSLVSKAHVINNIHLHVLYIMPYWCAVDFCLGQEGLRESCTFFPTRHINM